MERQQECGFADLALSRRKIKDDFFHQVDQMIDWRKIDRLIAGYYNKCASATGRPGYSGLVLFKICLLQTWYGLSDYEVESQVNDRLSFSRFAGISMDSSCPDHSVISRFRSALSEQGVYEKLFKAINEQLASREIIVKSGLIVDASLTDTPRRPKGKKEYEVSEDRQEDAPPSKAPLLIEKTKSGVDRQARWLKKAGKLHFGYKKHVATDENGMIRGLVTTAANESDTKHLEAVIDHVAVWDERAWLKADKGYKSQVNDQLLRDRKLKNHIMYKESKGRKLTPREQQCNRLISKIRYRVERTFGSMRRWFGAGIARYVGIMKTHTQHLMEAIAHNLYRSPGIIMSKGIM